MPVPAYQSYPYIYTSKGLVQRYAIDRMAPQTYWNTANSESRQENAIASRLGRHAITQNGVNNVPLPAAINTLAFLQGLFGANYRYAAAGTQLFRRAGETDGAYSLISSGFPLSGSTVAAAPYRPSQSSYPYIFFADADSMTKDNGTLATVEQMGIFAPVAPPTLSLGNYNINVINSFLVGTGVSWSPSVSGVTFTNGTAGATLGTAITTAPGIFTVTPSSMVGIQPQSLLQVGTEILSVLSTVGGSSFTAYFQNNHAATDPISNGLIEGTITGASTLGSIQQVTPFNLGAPEYTDAITIGIGVVAADDVSAVSVLIDVGDGTFTQAYYQYNFTSAQIAALGIYSEVAMPIASFLANGQAGNPGFTWANGAAWQVQITTASGASSVTFMIGDFYFRGGGGPNVTDGGSPYDYRITFYNQNTGDESGPSVILIPSSFVSPIGQPVLVSWPQALTEIVVDPQITHTRIYRRGGTLPSQWLQVGQVPITTTSFLDGFTDEQIAANNILDVDTAPPVTSTLAVPVSTFTKQVLFTGQNAFTVISLTNIFPNQVLTIDALSINQETVIVEKISGGLVYAWCQYRHENVGRAGTPIQATTQTGAPANIMAIAFDRAWIAGDPSNPNILYYSDRFNPESFPLENFLEIGTPSDPIMGIVEWNGQLYVFTQSTVWNILGANGASVPVPYKTAAHHGLYATYGWTVTDSELWFISQGGIYAFQGATDAYMSEPIEWVFTDQFIADSMPRPVIPLDPTYISTTVMEYYQNEVYVAYTGTDGNRHRVIYSKVYKRWRNDDAPATFMLLEDDTYKLLYGYGAGMIYQDRTGNYDDEGFSNGVQQVAPFTFTLQTAALDMGMPKNFKNFNELTLDIDTQGLDCNVTLLFDYGLTSVPIGTVNTTGRQQVDLKINGGQGQLSLNVSLLLTCTIGTTIANPITAYEAHIRATTEAELRASADTYLMDFGRPDYKIVKQCWLEVLAPDPAGVSFSCYIEGGSAPIYTFTIPQALTRTSYRVRLPAIKARIWRYVGTSNSPFRLYSDSRFEEKAITNDKNYTLSPFQQPSQTQP